MMWRVGQRHAAFNYRLGRYIIGKVIAHFPSNNTFEVMDNRGHVWTVPVDSDYGAA